MRYLPGEGLMAVVVDLVRERGPCTVDDLMGNPAVDGYTRTQVMKAMQGARERKRLDLMKRGGGRGQGVGNLPSTYCLGAAAPSPFPVAKQAIHVRPPASVWELGHGLQIAGEWPPAGEGRSYMLLSAGDAQEECA